MCVIRAAEGELELLINCVKERKKKRKKKRKTEKEKTREKERKTEIVLGLSLQSQLHSKTVFYLKDVLPLLSCPRISLFDHISRIFYLASR